MSIFVEQHGVMQQNAGSPTYRGVSAVATQNFGTSVVVSAPSGGVNGDLVLLAISLQGSGTVTTPSGFTLVTSVANSGGTGSKLYVFSKIFASDTTYTVSHTNGRSCGASIAIQNGSTTMDGPTTLIGNTGAGATTIATPSVTTTQPDSMIVRFVGGAQPSGGSPTCTWPGGTTERADGAASDEHVSIATSTTNQAAAGASGAVTCTWNTTMNGEALVVAVHN